MYEAIKTSFIALIPKSESPSSFNDFRPISLHNYRYKIISKVPANQLRPILSCHISLEKFSFLQAREIHEAISTTQEALHSLKTKKVKGEILKIDLVKAFDRLS